MFCTKCGKELFDEAIVCPNCGVATENAKKALGVSQETQKAQRNGMAIAGFVCSFFVPLLGWIFGGVGLARANKRGGKGKGFSISAIVIASVMFVLGLATL